MFLTGMNEWRRLDAWPPKNLQPTRLYFDAGGKLSRRRRQSQGRSTNTSAIRISRCRMSATSRGGMTGDYMTEDQRFASQRPDVLVYQTAPLDHDMIVAGPVKVNLQVSTTGTDADFVVKLVDVYPDDYPTPGADPRDSRCAPTR